MSGRSAAAERIRASDGESGWSTRGADRAVALRVEWGFAEVAGCEDKRQTGVSRKRRCLAGQREIARALSSDEAKRTLRRRTGLLTIVAGHRHAGRNIVTDHKVALTRRSEC